MVNWIKDECLFSLLVFVQQELSGVTALLLASHGIDGARLYYWDIKVYANVYGSGLGFQTDRRSVQVICTLKGLFSKVFKYI